MSKFIHRYQLISACMFQVFSYLGAIKSLALGLVISRQTCCWIMHCPGVTSLCGWHARLSVHDSGFGSARSKRYSSIVQRVCTSLKPFLVASRSAPAGSMKLGNRSTLNKQTLKYENFTIIFITGKHSNHHVETPHSTWKKPRLGKLKSSPRL